MLFLSILYPFVSTQTRYRLLPKTVTNISSLTSFTETSSGLVYYRGQFQFTFPLPSHVGNLTYLVYVYPGYTTREINQTVIMGEWYRCMQHTRVAECAEMRGVHATGEQSLSECLLCALYVPCINRMPGGAIVGDSGLCCCVAVVVRVTSTDRALLIPFVCRFVMNGQNNRYRHRKSLSKLRTEKQKPMTQ